MKIAVVGTGISGNLIARLLSTEFDVHVFEANSYVGGHTNTVAFDAFGASWKADTGFMVFNDRTYPNFERLLRKLGVEAQPSDMSFSVSCARTGLEYQGSSINGLFAQRSNLLHPRFYRLLWDIMRFNQASGRAIESGQLDDGTRVGDYLERLGLGDAFREHYLLPMVAAIWSARPESILDFPAKFLIGFLRNHGLLQLRDRPQWKTVSGGACCYVEQLVAPIRDRVRLSCPVESVTRHPDGVQIRTARGDAERFDQVVFASHADQTLAMLTDATSTEREVLASFPYQSNEAVLHTDTSLLPRRRRAWASWNYHLSSHVDEPATVTYDLSRLQRLGTPTPILLTLNRAAAISPESIIRRLTYHHPAYSRASIAAQRRFDEINGRRRTYFCGAYWGYGFHEDGVNSALAVAGYFGKNLESWTAASTKEKSLTAATSR